MSKESKRDFKVDQTVYVIDYWVTNDGIQASEAHAKILLVDEKNKTFNATLYGDTQQRYSTDGYIKYSFKDYGRLIFDTEKEAKEAADKLPKPKSVVYQKNGNRICKKTVYGIGGCYVDGAYDLIIRFKGGTAISTKEIGISIFLNKSDIKP